MTYLSFHLFFQFIFFLHVKFLKNFLVLHFFVAISIKWLGHISPIFLLGVNSILFHNFVLEKFFEGDHVWLFIIIFLIFPHYVFIILHLISLLFTHIAHNFFEKCLPEFGSDIVGIIAWRLAENIWSIYSFWLAATLLLKLLPFIINIFGRYRVLFLSSYIFWIIRCLCKFFIFLNLFWGEL